MVSWRGCRASEVHVPTRELVGWDFHVLRVVVKVTVVRRARQLVRKNIGVLRPNAHFKNSTSRINNYCWTGAMHWECDEKGSV